MKKSLQILSALFIVCSVQISAQWVEQNSGVSSSLNSVAFLDAETGWICGDNGIILHTTDGGENWTKQDSVTNENLNSIIFLVDNKDRGLAVGNNNTILLTTNGGSTWESGEYFAGSQNYNKVVSTNSALWFASNYSLYRIKQGEANIEKPFFGEIEDFDAEDEFVFALLKKTGGTFYNASTDNGTNWWTLDKKLSSHFASKVFFLNHNSGWLAGRSFLTDGAKLWRISNNGEELEELFQSDPNQGGFKGYYSSMYFISETTGWISLNYNHSTKIYRTDDGGISWSPSDQGLAQGYNIRDIYFTSENIGYVVGSQGEIYKTTTGGITSVNEEQESKLFSFNLSQNYPNPFNPSTTISYSLPKQSNVSLKVYDILGKEVAELVNSEKSAGSYEVDFNGESLSSGIYFYTLKTNNSMLTKKMMLIK